MIPDKLAQLATHLPKAFNRKRLTPAQKAEQIKREFGLTHGKGKRKKKKGKRKK
jgi:hypothetical protein